MPRIFLKEGVDYGRADFRAALAQAPFQITGSSCSLVKIACKSDEQKDAEAKVECFEEKLGPFVVAAETTRMPMVFADAKQAGNPIIFTDDSFLSLTGYDRKEVLAQLKPGVSDQIPTNATRPSGEPRNGMGVTEAGEQS